jgi:hypothetical protein
MRGRERTSRTGLSAKKERWAAGLEQGVWAALSSFFFFLKQTNTFEFKPGFESKHPKTMHQHECNTHTTIYLIQKFKQRIFPILYSL